MAPRLSAKCKSADGRPALESRNNRYPWLVPDPEMIHRLDAPCGWMVKRLDPSKVTALMHAWTSTDSMRMLRVRQPPRGSAVLRTLSS